MRSTSFTKLFITFIAVLMMMGSACATKKYVRNNVNERVTPLEGRTAELEDGNKDLNRRAGDLENGQTTLHNNINDVDGRATAGINQAKQQAGDAQAKANQADDDARQAGDEARLGNSRVDNLDNWQELKQVVVNFKVNQSLLSAEDKAELDQMAEQVKSEKGYLIEIRGFTDATGKNDRNQVLSETRAKAVFQYLATKHDIPSYKMNIVGFANIKPVADNHTRQGRAENRRVEVKLLVNSGIRRTPAAQPSQQGQVTPAEQSNGLRN